MNFPLLTCFSQIKLQDGTQVDIITTETISSKTARERDQMIFQMAEDVIVEGKVIIKGGAIVKGEIIEVEKRVSQSVAPTEEGAVLHGTSGGIIKPKTQGQKNIIQASEENDVIFAIGPAGTGKTYMAVALAVKALAVVHEDRFAGDFITDRATGTAALVSFAHVFSFQ